ncbi:MAG: hypothetical protein ACYTBJ_23435 [Planctomycetota bacterium]|jgi:hypothetical protein
MPDDIDQTTDQNDDNSPQFDVSQLAQIVNSAVTSQLNRMLPKALDGLNLDERLGQLVETKLPKQDPNPEPAAANPEKSQELLKLEQALKDMGSKLEAAEEARKAEQHARIQAENERRHSAAVMQLRGALEQEVRPELLDVAVGYLDKAQGRLSVDESGNPLLRVKRSPYKGAPEEDADLPLTEAAKLFLSSPEAAPFRPAPGGQQDGQRGQPARRAPVAPQQSGNGRFDESAALANTLAVMAEQGLSLP